MQQQQNKLCEIDVITFLYNPLLKELWVYDDDEVEEMVYPHAPVIAQTGTDLKAP